MNALFVVNHDKYKGGVIAKLSLMDNPFQLVTGRIW